MLYEFTDAVREIPLSALDPEKKTMGLITVEELQQNFAALGFAKNTVEECEGDDDSFRGALDIYGEYCFGILNLLNLPDLLGDRDRIGFYLKRNLFLLVDVQDADKSTTKAFLFAVEHAKTGQMSMEKLIYLVFDRLLYGDGKELERMEFAIDSMEEDVSHLPVAKDFNTRMLHMKKQLLVLRNYYEQLIDIGEELQENDCDFYAEENLRYFKLFTDKVMRLSANTQLLRESLVQLRESYDSAMDLSLNNIMKVFTVITAIFLPLTLVAGWYGMNFYNMPMLTWPYGYPVVIGVSVLIVVVCIWLFKKKKLM